MASLLKDHRNQAIGMLKAGSTVYNIVHHFGYSRQIHILVNRYTTLITGSVRDRARPGRARVPTVRTYRVNTSTHPRNRFYQLPLLQGRRRVFKSGPAEEAIECRSHERGRAPLVRGVWGLPWDFFLNFERFYVRF